MPKFTVWQVRSTDFFTEIEADSFDQAYEIANDDFDIDWQDCDTDSRIVLIVDEQQLTKEYI